MIFDRWQAPDRDSPETVEFQPAAMLGPQLAALLQMDGQQGTNDDAVFRVTGTQISRARRWHKVFERMGLLYRSTDGATSVTPLGLRLTSFNDSVVRTNRRQLAALVIPVLARYQLKNPADESPDAQYPENCDLHPYWAIWKAMAELEYRLHWDELNRALMHVLTHRDLMPAIERIRIAREAADYNPTTSAGLGPRAYDQQEAPEGRDADDQIRDQKTTPWFRRAGFGKLLFNSPGETSRDGYWRVASDVVDLLEDAVKNRPAYLHFATADAWHNYYGALSEDLRPTLQSRAVQPSPCEIQLRRVLLERHNAIAYGPPGTGKTTAALAIAEAWERDNGTDTVFRTTFHPNYTYEDFVQGFRPIDGGGFALQKGVFLVACEAAVRVAPARVLLLIDEINRGDTARIFGELLTYIESDKRGVEFRLAQDTTASMRVPANLFILGTMNTADRSVSLLDVAFRRRFAFVFFPPDASVFNAPPYLAAVDDIHLPTLLRRINERLREAGVDAERQIGQGTLLLDRATADPLQALRDRMTYEVIPTVFEYCYPNARRVRSVLGDLVDDSGSARNLSDGAFVLAVTGII